MQHRFSRGRSKERTGRRSPHSTATTADGDLAEHDSQDYAADNSSEHSSSATQSPRHRATTIGGSPLARPSLFRLRSQQSKEALETSAPNATAAIVSMAMASNSVGQQQQQQQQATLDVLHADEQQRRREAQLRQHSFFQLRVHLISGSDLVAMDKNGTSDPYVKFKLNGRMLHKSKTVHRDLNPVWDETFVVPVEDPFQPINVKVFDYDWGLQDDFMGTTKLDLTQVELGRLHELCLKLEDPSNACRPMGELRVNVTLWPRSQEDKEQVYCGDSIGSSLFYSLRCVSHPAGSGEKKTPVQRLHPIHPLSSINVFYPLAYRPEFREFGSVMCTVLSFVV